MTEQTKIIQLQDTLNRYLLYFPRSKSTVVDVHSFIGEETLSKPYRYTIRFPVPMTISRRGCSQSDRAVLSSGA